MNRTNIAGTSPYEPIVGFSRAVRVGNTIHVAGTAPVGAEDLSAYEQARAVFALIGKALTDAGAGANPFTHVVRTRTYITHTEDWQEIGRAHGEIFSNIRPAATMVTVKELLNPKWRVEIEADAFLP
jgi:enamine deaminase RidA (YjgF/YER057c/UK114 family)